MFLSISLGKKRYVSEEILDFSYQFTDKYVYFIFKCQIWSLKFYKIWLIKCQINVIQGVIFLLWYSFSTALVRVSIDIHTESVNSTEKLGFYLKRRHCQHGQAIHIWSQDIVFTHFEILLTSAKYWWQIQYNIKYKDHIPR